MEVASKYIVNFHKLVEHCHDMDLAMSLEICPKALHNLAFIHSFILSFTQMLQEEVTGQLDSTNLDICRHVLLAD